jgi:hypothetical protein
VLPSAPASRVDEENEDEDEEADEFSSSVSAAFSFCDSVRAKGVGKTRSNEVFSTGTRSSSSSFVLVDALCFGCGVLCVLVV